MGADKVSESQLSDSVNLFESRGKYVLRHSGAVPAPLATATCGMSALKYDALDGVIINGGLPCRKLH